MDKFILEVKAPANNKIYEFLIPKNMKAGDAAAKIAAEICEFEKNPDMYDVTNLALCHADGGKVLQPHKKLAEEGIRSGMQLLLI
jgi:hypothetical protein